jgi:ubiquinone/menaquinone biosynthesis C-methylase UbiE
MWTRILHNRNGKKAKTVIAVDLQTEMLTKAQQKAAKADVKNIRFLQSNGKSIQVDNDSVDLILLVTVFHEIVDSTSVLGEFNRILKSGGKLAIVETTKKGIIPGAPLQNPQTIQTEVESANFKHLQSLPYKNYSILIFTKKA